MKLAVFTVVLPQHYPHQAPALVRTAGFEGIEWRIKREPIPDPSGVSSFWKNNRCTLVPSSENGRLARELAQAAGLAMPAVAAYVEVGQLEELEAALEFAAAAKIDRMRLLTARWSEGRSYRDELARTLSFWRDAVPRARDAGVRLLVETHHDTIAPSISLAMRVLDHFDARDTGLLFDPGNMVFEGYEAYDIGLALAGDYLAHVHLKNVRFERRADGLWEPDWAPMREGRLDFGLLFRSLQRAGYDGWISIEDFGNVDHSVDYLHQTGEFLREAWSSAYKAGAK